MFSSPSSRLVVCRHRVAVHRHHAHYEREHWSLASSLAPRTSERGGPPIRPSHPRHGASTRGRCGVHPSRSTAATDAVGELRCVDPR